MKTTLHISILALVLSGVFCLWFKETYANQLTDVRIGEHGAYTRIVFEFKNTIRHTNSVKKNEERVTVVFPKGAGIKESSLLPEVPKNQRVKSLVLNKQGKYLCADITMPSADFTTKLRYLPKPERVVLDIYGETFIPEKVVTAITPQTRPAAIAHEVKAMKHEALPQPPQSSNMQIYWSVLLLINLIMVTILGLMSNALLKLQQRLSARWKNGIPGFPDKSIDLIDSEIQEELKKYRGLAQTAQTAGS
jgi:hypothetical protein